jgi:hypothetical protein
MTPPRRFPALEPLEDRTLLAGNSVDTATPISYTPGSPAVQSGTLSAGSADFYQLTVTEPGRLTARVHAAGFSTRLSLLDPNGGGPLIQSDGVSAADPDDLIVQHLEAGDAGNTYYLEVQGPDGGAGDYTLTTQFDLAPSPFPPAPPVNSPVAVVVGNFTNDGLSDLVSADATSGTIAIRLRQGPAAVQQPVPIVTVSQPTALVAADFNGDGRLDLAVATADGLVILLGNGDGTFQRRPTIPFPAGRPLAIVAGDFNGDHHIDLATVNSTDDVWTFLGTGRGTFAPAGRFALPAGAGASAIAAGDFAGRGRLDLAVTESNRDAVAVLRGLGDGTFGPAVEYAVQVDPVGLVVGDFTGAGRDDLAVANHGGDGGVNDDGSISVLLSNPDGTFQDTDPNAISQEVGTAPVAIAVGHFSGSPDTPLDLATADATYGDVSVLQGQGDGTFVRTSVTVGGTPASLAAGDLDGSGSSLLAVGNGLSGGVTTVLAVPDSGGFYFSIDPTLPTGARPTPLLANVNGEGINDSITVSRAGAVLLRAGQASPPGALAPAVPANPPGHLAWAVTPFRAGPQTLLAAIDRPDDNVSLYAVDPGGKPRLVGSLATESGSLPTRILAGNLRGVQDGYDDLAVLNALSGRVTVFLSDGRGGFGPPETTDLGGSGPFDMTLADLLGDGLRDDIVVVDRASGDLNVLVNDGDGSFFALERYRAGVGPYGVSADGTTLLSEEQTAGVVAGDFDGDGTIDLLTANAGSNSLALLRGRGDGTFYSPVSIPLDFSPEAIAAGRFDGSGFLDLAVLDAAAGQVRVLLGDGEGNFRVQDSDPPLGTGAGSTNLSVADVDNDGTADLQVGNVYGDVLTLLGNGDGTFRTFQTPNTDRTIDLAVTDGRHFVLSNRAGDRLAEQSAVGSPSRVFQDRADGILAPGQVRTVTVAGTEYLVVANGGANDVLVYRGAGDGTFDAASVQTFFVGTDPVGITIADVNGDGIPDVVVANQGSNDVSVLLGQGSGAAWTLTPGPRLASGGTGPVSTTVANVNGGSVPDLFVVNRQSNTVALLPGVGNGFFDDRSPRTFATGAGPVQAFVGNFDGSPGLLTIDAGGNDLTLFSNFGPGRSIASGGLAPVAGFAGDFTGDGFTDLVIANNGDGVFTALLGGPDGLQIAGTLTSADVLHPTAVAFADLSAGGLSIFATEEGVESVARLTFALDFGIPVLTPGSGEPAGPRPLVSELLPLNESTLDIVATLVTGSGLPSGAADVGLFLGTEGASGLIVLSIAFSGGAPGFVEEGGSGASPGTEVLRPTPAGGAPAGNAESSAFGTETGSLSDFVIGLGAEADRVREGVRRRWRDPERVPPSPRPEAPRDEVFRGWLPGGAERLEQLEGLEAAVSAAALGEPFLLPQGVPEGRPAPAQPDVPAEANSSPGPRVELLPLPNDEPRHAPRPGSLKPDLSSSGGGDPKGRNTRDTGEEPERWLQSLVAALVVCGVKVIGGRDRWRGLSPRRNSASDSIRG